MASACFPVFLFFQVTCFPPRLIAEEAVQIGARRPAVRYLKIIAIRTVMHTIHPAMKMTAIFFSV